MGYNIDTVRVKKLENFIIPLKSLYESERKDWLPKQPVIKDFETNEVQISMGCGQTIEGILKDGNIHVSKMNISGEGSGSLMEIVLKNSFEKSSGSFEAVLIWEEGDSIECFKINEGIIVRENVYL